MLGKQVKSYVSFRLGHESQKSENHHFLPRFMVQFHSIGSDSKGVPIKGIRCVKSVWVLLLLYKTWTISKQIQETFHLILEIKVKLENKAKILQIAFHVNFNLDLHFYFILT